MQSAVLYQYVLCRLYDMTYWYCVRPAS